jgi:hypothetical protein
MLQQQLNDLDRAQLSVSVRDRRSPVPLFMSTRRGVAACLSGSNMWQPVGFDVDSFCGVMRLKRSGFLCGFLARVCAKIGE